MRARLAEGTRRHPRSQPQERGVGVGSVGKAHGRTIGPWRTRVAIGLGVEEGLERRIIGLRNDAGIEEGQLLEQTTPHDRVCPIQPQLPCLPQRPLLVGVGLDQRRPLGGGRGTTPGLLEASNECGHDVVADRGHRPSVPGRHQTVQPEEGPAEDDEPDERLAKEPSDRGGMGRGHVADSHRKRAALRRTAPEATTHPLSRWSAQTALFVATLAVSTDAAAHRLDPGLLVLEVSGRTVEGTWTPPVTAPALQPRLPDGCVPRSPPEGVRAVRATCPDPLVGTITRVGPGAAQAEVVVRIDRGHGAETTTLTAGQPQLVLTGALAPQGAASAIWHAIRQGVPHVLGGADHVLFVLGLVLLVPRSRQLLGAVTAFTAGHSLTLALAAAGRAPLPSGPVEVCIALSVLLLAVELRLDRDTLARRRPWLVAGLFGLVHGLGFAGALADAGLPPDRALETVLGFNIGVEIAQLLIVAVAVPLGAWSRGGPAWRRSLPATVLGAAGVAWTLDRVLGMLPS